MLWKKYPYSETDIEGNKISEKDNGAKKTYLVKLKALRELNAQANRIRQYNKSARSIDIIKLIDKEDAEETKANDEKEGKVPHNLYLGRFESLEVTMVGFNE